MVRILRSRIFMCFLCVLLLLGIYLVSPGNRVFGSFQTTKVGILNKSKQKTISEFKKEEKKYAYVSFNNLYENTTLYYGTRIYQTGHIKKLDMEHKYLLVVLDGNDVSRIVRLKYNLSNFAKDDINLQENDSIRFYGKVLSIDNYMNDKGREMRRPVIAADFIQTKLGKQGENYAII